MNYRHGFHSGNFADVHKHSLLVAVLDHLTAKPAPFCYIDTHAGRGEYDLQSAEAARSQEWRDGIGALLATADTDRNGDLRRYAGLLRELGVETPTPSWYPGSPRIAAGVMRATDRAVLVEKHPEEAAALRTALGRRRNTAVISGDGYRELKGQLPPRERRGLVLLDPPYESTSEYADLGRSLIAAHARWPTGIYMAWYPIKAGDPAMRLRDTLRASSIRRILHCELTVRPRDATVGLNGSGLVLINPPWQLDLRAAEMQTALCDLLAVAGQGSSLVDWLVPE